MDAIPKLTKALAGRYEIEREIGAGGMATVYLARDVKHHRNVALKLLKAELGAVLGGDRFLAEIRVTANLQHPHLLPLFDSGEAEGLLFYVMPFIEGESLRGRLERETQLPVDDALHIAIAVASALEYAHAQGVVHRDLKPENVLLQGGEPIVADFGIALAVSKAGGQRVTQTGISLGTPQYMSPEQATGDRIVDARADIYSLAAVLYEMLTGEPPHAGPSTQSIIAKLLTEEPRPIKALRRAVPDHVADAVHHALEKLPADRFASARQFADVLQGKSALAGARARSAAMPNKKLRWVAGGATAVAVVSLVVAVGLWRASTDAVTERRARYPLAFQGDAKFMLPPAGGVGLTLSPDGSQLVYAAGGAVPDLYVKKIDELEPKPLSGSADAYNPQFSPDGRWIAFTVRGALQRIPAAGGVPVTLVDSVERFSWGDGDALVFVRPLDPKRGLWRASATGGAPQRLASPADPLREEYTWPHVLPGGKAALMSIVLGRGDSAELAVVKLNDGSVERLAIQGLNPRFLSSGHLAFSLSNGTVMAAPFDVAHLRVTGPAAPVLEHVYVRGRGATQYAVSKNGTLVYVNEGAAAQLVLVDRTGRSRLLRPEPVRFPYGIRFSPDGKHIAFQRGRPMDDANIWVYTISTGVLTQLTSDNKSVLPSWSADSRRVVWTVFGDPVQSMWQPWDASESPTRLVDLGFAEISPSGEFLLGTHGVTGDPLIKASMPVSAQRSPIPESNHIFFGSPRISPDGLWMTYVMRAGAGPAQTYVEAVSGPGGRHLISENGGIDPAWGSSNHELFYHASGWLWSARIQTSPAFAVMKRDSLFAMNTRGGYDVSSDGKTFAMHWLMGDENPPPVLVAGWFSELREKMALAGKGR